MRGSSVWRAAIVLLLAWTTAAAQTGNRAPLKDRAVSEVLGELREQGLKLVFSDALVPPSLRVKQEPREKTPRAIVEEILAEHGLALREESRGALLVVRAKRSPALKEQQTLAPPREQGWIEGVVLDQATQKPVSSAVVLVEATGAYATTGDNGRFKIEGVPAGVQTVRVDASGYEPVSSRELRVSPRRATTLAIEITRSSKFHELVTVAASSDSHAPGATSSSYAIANEEIRRSAGSLGDINRFVQSLPGLAAVGDIRNDLVTRGGSPVENLIRVDGFETPTLSHFSTVGSSGGVISLLNNELIADATFMAGAFPSEFGDRLSSVLDIRLREGNRTRHAFEADVNFAGASIVGEGPLGSGGSWIISARRSFVDLLANSAGIKSVPEMSAYTFKTVYDVGPRNKIWAVAVGGADRVDFNMDPEDLDEPDFVGVEQRAARVMIGAAWQHLLWSRAFGVFSFSGSTANYRVDMHDRQLGANDVILRDRSKENSTTIRYDFSWQPANAWNVKTGWWVKTLWRGLNVSQPRGVETPYSMRPREDTPGLEVNVETASPIVGAYVESSVEVLPRTTATAGVRLEKFEALGQTTTAAPRASIETRVSPSVRISIAAGRYHQQPELVTVMAVPSNVNLRPIESDHVIAGVRYEPQPGLQMSAEVYRKWYRAYPVSLEYPQLTLANHGSEFNGADLLLLPMSSVGKGRVRGMELFLKKRLSGRVYGQIAYSFSQTEQAALDRTFHRGSFDTPHVLTVVGGYRMWRQWEMSGRFTLASGRPYTPPLLPASVEQNRLVYDLARFNAARLPAYHRLDLRIDRKFALLGRHTSFFAEMQNIYNHRTVIEYSWNQKTRELHPEKQLGILPVVGINIEF